MTGWTRLARAGALAVAACVLAACAMQVTQGPDAAAGVREGELGGVVTGRNGPEAGVWVIAETTDLPTKFAKIVVTDDQGRYVLPDLPKASYDVWVRGYGLVDSPKVKAQPGKRLDLKAVPAPNAKAAAKYAKQFAPVKLFTIDDVFGGWDKAQAVHFADGRVFDRITARK